MALSLFLLRISLLPLYTLHHCIEPLEILLFQVLQFLLPTLIDKDIIFKFHAPFMIDLFVYLFELILPLFQLFLPQLQPEILYQLCSVQILPYA